MGGHWTAEWHWTVIPFPWKLTKYSQDVCILDCTLKVSVSQPQNFRNVPTIFDLVFLPKQQFSIETFWCLETKLWSKVVFFQHIQGYAETSVWFDHVTGSYCSGKINLIALIMFFEILECRNSVKIRSIKIKILTATHILDQSGKICFYKTILK